jgi:hypothetical protein
MDNRELYSEILKLDSKLYQLRLDTSDRISKIWLVMLVGFELFVFLVFFSLMHRASEDSVHETRGEIAAVRAQAPPQAANPHRAP